MRLFGWRPILTKLLMLSAILLSVTLLSSTATAQSSTTDSAGTSQQIPPASDDVLLQRLDKALDAFEKSQKALGFAMDEIEQRKRLDALKDQIIAVKDIIIKAQDELIDRLQKNKTGFMERVKKILKVAEKIALIGLGVYISR
jgi:hypothetical protein